MIIVKLKGVLPAVRSIKYFEKVLQDKHAYIVLLESRLSQISSITKYARQNNQKLLIHADLIQGMKTDEYGFEFLLREVKPAGIISTRSNMIAMAKKNKLIAIQRLFALDSHALEHNIAIINKVKPDYIEVLPGIIPEIIGEIHQRTNIPVIAGGLIRTKTDVEKAYNNGAIAVTTSASGLWNLSSGESIKGCVAD